MKEHPIQNEILRTFGTRSDMRIWRANTGAGVPASIVASAIREMRQGNHSRALQLLTSCSVTFGIPGQADISGILATGRRFEIEVKGTTGRQRDEQVNYQRMIERFGGLYVLARSVEDVMKAVEDAMKAVQG